MESNEIMMNEEVTEAVETAAEEITKKGSGKFKTAALGGLTVLIGGLAVQYIVIPTIAKIRTKRKNQDVVVNGEFTEISDEENDSEEDIED